MDIAKDVRPIESRNPDLAPRNHLLNHRPSKRIVSVVDGSPRELYELVVARADRYV